ncbi:probable phosphoglycerate mutase [Chitinophaga jiangningensis]|uniref:Probable phosphoglycerate mutase n=1 Tax=Chitinophaga jiangningensis TaxID=1419482 RepID=A0A1M6Y2P4_9BACT|nr:histidine phosphatase family protein [Chitinophaga jiangningensis]SHL12521.1 probable phosphoglycerate mutase [Chitinophaga jiangningensis]
MTTRIAIIRHGSTAWNKAGKLQGSSDIPLDEEGREQARRLGLRLMGETYDIVYSSRLQRAKETAQIIADAMQHPHILLEDDRIREAGGGLTEGTTEEERVSKWGSDWKQLDLGIETPEEVVARGTEFLSELVAKYPGKKILIVSHGGFIRKMIRELVPDAPHQHMLKNTSITEILHSDNSWSCHLYNCVQHLED